MTQFRAEYVKWEINTHFSVLFLVGCFICEGLLNEDDYIKIHSVSCVRYYAFAIAFAYSFFFCSVVVHRKMIATEYSVFICFYDLMRFKTNPRFFGLLLLLLLFFLQLSSSYYYSSLSIQHQYCVRVSFVAYFYVHESKCRMSSRC